MESTTLVVISITTIFEQVAGSQLKSVGVGHGSLTGLGVRLVTSLEELDRYSFSPLFSLLKYVSFHPLIFIDHLLISVTDVSLFLCHQYFLLFLTSVVHSV